MFFFLQERSNIEKEYAKQLKQWSNKWESIIQKGDFSKYHPKGDFSSSKTSSKKVGKHLSPLKRWKRGKHKLSEAFSFAKHCCLERRMHMGKAPQSMLCSRSWFHSCSRLEQWAHNSKEQNTELWVERSWERERTVFENVRVISQRVRHRLPREWRRALAPFSSLAGADQPGKHTK